MTVSLLWLRRDLRVHEHPALEAARQKAQHLLVVFVLDDRLLKGRNASGPRTQFLLDCLSDLDRSLRERGSRLVLRRGDPERELLALCRDHQVARVHFTADVSPYARRRDERISTALSNAGVDAHPHPGMFAVDDLDALRTSGGEPYTVFTPFYRAWLKQERRRASGAPRSLPAPPPGVDPGRTPELTDLGLTQELTDPTPGGEQAARKAMTAFLTRHVDAYDDARDLVGVSGASRLSPYLHFGCLSPRELEHRLTNDSEGARAYRRQLCWRDFYAHVLWHFPANATQEYQERYRGTLAWPGSDEHFQAWCAGRTGYPLVDAGMRQLAREGWMHNRARLVVGSFLTKDLGLDWRRGERWFMRLLIDGDEASNNGNWQWIASTGVDPQPAFRRIFNPARQQARFDPDGRYVRRYVPELEPVPDRYLAEPWTMPEPEQARVGCVIGRDYPRPIVDHLQARREALARYADAARDGS